MEDKFVKNELSKLEKTKNRFQKQKSDLEEKTKKLDEQSRDFKIVKQKHDAYQDALQQYMDKYQIEEKKKSKPSDMNEDGDNLESQGSQGCV